MKFKIRTRFHQLVIIRQSIIHGFLSGLKITYNGKTYIGDMAIKEELYINRPRRTQKNARKV